MAFYKHRPYTFINLMNECLLEKKEKKDNVEEVKQVDKEAKDQKEFKLTNSKVCEENLTDE